MEHTITSEQMESMKALADLNMKLSEGKNSLYRLQEQESEYLEEREEKAMRRIQEVVDASRGMVREANENYSRIMELSRETAAFIDEVNKVQALFQETLRDFNERNQLWEKEMERQQNQIDEAKRLIMIDRNLVENERKSIERARISLAEDRKRVESDRGTVDRAIKRLKNNRI